MDSDQHPTSGSSKVRHIEDLRTVVAERRVRLRVDERRAQLLELGTHLFTTRPYDDISIDDIAEAAGISKGLLYHYFQGKREFYVETIRAASIALRRLTKPDPNLAPGARLRAAVDAHLNYVQHHGPVYAAIYRSSSAIAPEVNNLLEEHRAVVMRYFLQDFGINKPRPILRSALRSWIAMVEGASLDWLLHPGVEREALCEVLVAGYLGMLRKAVELDPEAAASLGRLLKPVRSLSAPK